jgi:hypothetical protein
VCTPCGTRPGFLLLASSLPSSLPLVLLLAACKVLALALAPPGAVLPMSPDSTASAAAAAASAAASAAAAAAVTTTGLPSPPPEVVGRGTRVCRPPRSGEYMA